jgi:hypothetical protein
VIPELSALISAAIAGSRCVASWLGGRAVPALALFELSKVLKIERPDVMAVRV